MVNITINDVKIQAKEGMSVLDAARQAKIKIPTLCFHKELSPYGACRLCLVEIVGGGRPSLQVSCLYPVSEGLTVKTDTERIKKVRNILLEMMLARWPDSEKVKEVAKSCGVTQTRIKQINRRNCILCGLCARVCAEVTGMHSINFTQRGIRRKIQTPFDKMSEVCIGCGACAYVCPTGNIKIEQA